MSKKKQYPAWFQATVGTLGLAAMLLSLFGFINLISMLPRDYQLLALFGSMGVVVWLYIFFIVKQEEKK